jgi:hypothetical protein
MGENSVRTITYDLLRGAGACKSQRYLFRRLFPNGVVPTAELIAAHPEFNYLWAAEHLLTGAARAEYERIEAPARAEYERAIALAWADYECADAAWADYERTDAAAWADYQRAVVAVFLAGWEKMQ